MTKLCPRGKRAAKAKFAVYPSAYANAYASKICAGKIKDPSGKKRKDFKGPKPAKKGTMVKAALGVLALGMANKKKMEKAKKMMKDNSMGVTSAPFGVGVAMAKNRKIKEILGVKKGRMIMTGAKYIKYLRGLKQASSKSLLAELQKKGLTVPLSKTAGKFFKNIGVFPAVSKARAVSDAKDIIDNLSSKSFIQRRIALGGGRAGLLLKGATAIAKGLKKLKPSKKMSGGMIDYYKDLI